MGEVAKIGSGGVAARSSRLAISAEQEQFTHDQVAALKKMNGWRDVPEAELAVFFHQAKRTGLDPFSKQIYLIPRGGNFTIQTSIDGMRLVADRTGRYAGSDRPIFGKDGDDEYAEITVYKLVGSPPTRYGFTSVAYKSEYSSNQNLWKKMPKTMLAKCAEAQALRKAFPADLSGMYGSEEMDQASSPTAPSTTESHHDGEVVDAEVVSERQSEPRPQGNTSKRSESGELSRKLSRNHQAMVDEVERLLKQTPEGFFEDPDVYRQRAREGFKEAMDVRRELHDAIAEGMPSKTRSEDEISEDEEAEDEDEKTSESEDIDLDEDDVAEVERMSGGASSTRTATEPKALKSQVDLLKTLLVEARGDEGIEKLEAHVGKPITELTRTEADGWIDRLTPEQSEQPEGEE